MYKYFVSYNFYTETASGFGSVEMTMPNKIKGYKDVLDIHNWILDNCDFKGQKLTQVCILNFILLK